MQKICKNCRYWEEAKRLTQFYWRANTITGKMTGYCSCRKFVYGEAPDDDGFQYWDSEHYYAGFRTAPEFGCIHFKKRDILLGIHLTKFKEFIKLIMRRV